MNKSFIKSIPPMKWEEIKKIKEEIRRIKPEDIAPLTSEERKQMADNKDVYEYLSFDVQIKLLGIKPENVKTTPFGDNTFFCIGVLEGKRNIEGKLTESEEVNLKYLIYSYLTICYCFLTGSICLLYCLYWFMLPGFLFYDTIKYLLVTFPILHVVSRYAVVDIVDCAKEVNAVPATVTATATATTAALKKED